MTDLSDSKAPLLNLTICVLLEVDPSGKITNGDLVVRPYSIAAWRSSIRATVFSRASGVPPLGTKMPSVA